MRQRADRTERFRPLGGFPRVTKVPPVADSGQPYLHIGPCGGRRKRACALDDRARALSGRPFDVAIDQQVRHPVSTLRALWPVSVLGAPRLRPESDRSGGSAPQTEEPPNSRSGIRNRSDHCSEEICERSWRRSPRWRRLAADAATPTSSPSGKAAGTPSAPPSESARPSVRPRSMRSATLFGRAKTGPQATQERSMSPTKAAPKVEIWSVTGPDRANGDMGSQRFVSAARTPNPQRDQFRLTGSPP